MHVFQVLERTLRDEIAPNLQDWMQTATPDGICVHQNHTYMYIPSSMYLKIFFRETNNPENVEIS